MASHPECLPLFMHLLLGKSFLIRRDNKGRIFYSISKKINRNISVDRCKVKTKAKGVFSYSYNISERMNNIPSFRRVFSSLLCIITKGVFNKFILNAYYEGVLIMELEKYGSRVIFKVAKWQAKQRVQVQCMVKGKYIKNVTKCVASF